jgi:hypothetical protein
MDVPEAKLFRAAVQRPGNTSEVRAWMRYLRERNNPRGEFIATQLSLLNATAQSENYFRLITREQRLLALYRETWAPERCREICTAVRFRAGMAVGLMPPWIYYDEKLHAIRFQPNGAVALMRRTDGSVGSTDTPEPIFAVERIGVYACRPDFADQDLTGSMIFTTEKNGDATITFRVNSTGCMLAANDGTLARYIGSYPRRDTPFTRSVITSELRKRKLASELADAQQRQAEQIAQQSDNPEPELSMGTLTKALREIRSGQPQRKPSVPARAAWRMLPRANTQQLDEIAEQIEELEERSRRDSPTDQTNDREIQL